MGEGIEDMDFDGKVKVVNRLAKAVLPGRWTESERGDVLKSTGGGIHVDVSSGDAQGAEVSRDTITVTYLSRGMGEAYHLFDHYQGLFGNCCDVLLREDGCSFVKVEE